MLVNGWTVGRTGVLRFGRLQRSAAVGNLPLGIGATYRNLLSATVPWVRLELIGEIHDLLVPGGVFANLDLVSSASEDLHERFRREIGRTQDDPTDQLADLSEQIRWLRSCFAEVDCHFKWLELALMVAVK